ncbi:CBS domain-containing protein [Acidocella sp. KAb 2-4]|uniref:CBS domain-containing protein n=1 Tax=Acidocella sp. KAb 2-4 TaxID=2885158 RepID=UPI001D08EA54|nr:CBS domain-containing protein [Acidocella sp. KAb 2-4]MCB5944412.1 CBS domain-containing protein [Acidocella sp. KAb 2-4]
MTVTAADLMTRDLVMVRQLDNVSKVAGVLAGRGISAAPVVDAEGKLLGMVSEEDLMRQLGAEHESRRAWWLQMLAEGEDLAPDFLEYLKQEKRTAADVMSREVVTVAPDAPVSEIVDLFAKHRIKRVPVVQEGKVVGIVSRADIIRAIAAGRLTYGQPNG